ncbi:MAG: DUF4350 domain-containing protein [Defluviitaleaceae bacterium]|nr:DUF4350 domain-containing protein [Defluviitaleaceae bacterium]
MILVLFVFVVNIFSFDDGGAAFSSLSAGDSGTSLLFDTLRYMGYNVRAGYQPLTRHTSANYIYVVIRPTAPPADAEIAREMLEWVRAGGRLIFLCTSYPRTIIHQTAGFTGRFGLGETVTGQALHITNRFLKQNPSPGREIQEIIHSWHIERPAEAIIFAEYYHGFHAEETLLGRLPLVLRLIFAQAIIVAAMLLWHFGKRFGNAKEFYEETEREENEYVRALARLYMNSDRKRRK